MLGIKQGLEINIVPSGSSVIDKRKRRNWSINGTEENLEVDGGDCQGL